jgi:hypothetical protein
MACNLDYWFPGFSHFVYFDVSHGTMDVPCFLIGVLLYAKFFISINVDPNHFVSR